jgi:hypothetical protein
MATRAARPPRSRASCGEASQPAWHAAAPAAEASTVLRALRGARPAEPCLRLLKRRDKAGLGHTEKEPKQRYPQILTRSGPRPIVPVGRPLRPRSPQALPRSAPLPAAASFPPRAPEAPKGRPAQASSRRPEDPPPVQLERAAALRGQADRHDSPKSPQLPRPRGRVPPRPVPAPWTRTLTSRPQIPMAPAHLEAGSMTPGPASDWAKAKMGCHVVVLVIIIVVVRRLRRRLPREPVPLLPPTASLQGAPSPHPLAGPGLFRVLLLLLLLHDDPLRGSVHRVLRDQRQGGLVKPQPLETNGNPDGKNQRQLGAK